MDPTKQKGRKNKNKETRKRKGATTVGNLEKTGVFYLWPMHMHHLNRDSGYWKP
jgi:hypothetical protein